MASQEILKLSHESRSSSTTSHSKFYRFWVDLSKRSFDFVMALIGLIILSPVFAYIAYFIKRDSPGPVFYLGPRMGRNRKPFNIIKFRTMFEDPRSYNGPRVTAQGDDRITPLGHWLRDTKINELPQLWNVLIGEMSLVGPRPEDVKIAEDWPADAADEILSVRPGVTSPASILYHDEERLLSGTNLMGDYFKNILPDKMRLDRLYIRYHSFFSDIDIIFWTLAILVPRIAKTRIPEGYIFAGPLTVLVRRYLRWFTLDLVTTLIAVLMTSILWRISAPLDWGITHLAALGILMAVLFSSVNSIFGVNKVVWSKAKFDDAVGLGFSCGFATLTILICDFLQARYQWLPYPSLPPMMIVTVGFLAGTGFVAVRYRLRFITAIANVWLSWRKNKVNVGERMIIIGMDEGTQIASWLVQRHMFRSAFSVVGMVDHVDPTIYGMKVNGLWVLGSINDLPALLQKYDVGVILSALPQNSPENEYLFALQKAAPVRIIFLNDLLWIVDQQVTKPVGTMDFPLWLDERMEFKALHDTLTELPNWALFQDRLRHSLAFAKRNISQRGFMFVELNGLPIVQDDLSRNTLLKEIATRLNKAKRNVDTLARVNDEMFALLLENVPDKLQLDSIQKRITCALAAPFKIWGKEIKIQPNIYVNICNGACGVADDSRNANVNQCYECVRIKNSAIKSEVSL